MRLARLLVPLVLVAAGCASVDERRLVDTPVVLGMSKADLRSYFGEPRRVVVHPDGREDWFYRFGHVEHLAAPPPSAERGLLANTFRRTKRSVAWDAPVHLSDEGTVIAPVPEGAIERR